MQQAFQEPEDAELQEQLVAYLDGELDAPTVERIEALIATDPRVRDQLHKLEQAWELLDVLPQTQVEKDFTSSTIAMVAVSASQELAGVRRSDSTTRWRRVSVATAGVLLSAAMGYAVVSAMPHPNDALARDLPLLERLDELKAIDDIEFLRKLQASDMFPAEGEPNER